jgi:ribokinase
MVVVFGSINLDLVARVPRFPQPGETLAGDSFAMYPGGKGANQALAAARAGAAVAMVGAVGRDAFATPAIEGLVAGGVDVSAVRSVDGPTGVALIEVAASGENTILVIAGANAHADASDASAEWLRPSTVVVLQQEVPAAANLALARRARAAGARVVLNAAPARAVDPALLDLVNVIVVNETEMRALAAPADCVEPAAFAAAMASRHGNAVVITLGAAGALAVECGTCYVSPAPPVAVVDSTGAGDAFVGALAAALERGLPLRAALSWAVAAGSLACTENGAQPSLPDAARIAPVAALLDARLSVTPVSGLCGTHGPDP